MVGWLIGDIKGGQEGMRLLAALHTEVALHFAGLLRLRRSLCSSLQCFPNELQAGLLTDSRHR